MVLSLGNVAEGLMWAMQFSVLLPLRQCWRGWAALPPPLRLLGWYFPLSIASVVLARSFHVLHIPNHLIIILFNASKIIVVGIVLRQVLHLRLARHLTAAALLLGLGIIAVSLWRQPLLDGIPVARLTQCVALAVVSLAYLEQLSRTAREDLTADPYFWLSIGQLAYAAVTVTIIALTDVQRSMSMHYITAIFIALAGLFQNFTLYKAYAAGSRPAVVAPS